MVSRASAIGHRAWEKIPLGIANLINGDFAAGAVLISFGAVIGRISADQLLMMAIVEVVLYSINEAILVHKYEIADIGGTMVIHCFGAYFGLACSWALNIRDSVRKKSTYNNKSNPTTDTMAMVGTLFLFCFWPSFNSALAGPSAPEVQQRTVVNTLLAICCSAFSAFMMCRIVYEGKFRMVEVQNSTIAGGVAIGACADMITTPAGAMTIGIVAGTVSVLGYRYLQLFLENKINLRDTCGVHNLHGMPSVLGAFASAIVARKAEYENYGASITDTFVARTLVGGVETRSSLQQAKYQLAGLGTTLAIAIVGGLLTGLALNALPMLEYFFTDNLEYEGLEGHGAGGRKIKQSVAAMIRWNSEHGSAEVTRRQYFDTWMRWATKGEKVLRGGVALVVEQHASPKKVLADTTLPGYLSGEQQ